MKIFPNSKPKIQLSNVYTLKQPVYAGYYEIFSNNPGALRINLQNKPSLLRRLTSRVFLGWVWHD